MTEPTATDSTPNLRSAESSDPKCIRAGATVPVCGIVVAYFPDQGFHDRIGLLIPQVDQLVIVDNTPTNCKTLSLRDVYHNPRQIHLIENQANAGISAALNQGLDHALEAGYRWILTLDQDTRCFPNMVETLLEALEECAPTPVIVGGNYVDPRNDRLAVPAGNKDGFIEQFTVITSGCLVDAHFAAEAGRFREDFFIDQVDHEFCLRARTLGKKVVISKKPVMHHSVGEANGVWLPLLGVMPNHSPLRKYYIARNTIATVAQYWRREPAWCLRRLSRLMLGLGFMGIMESQRTRKIHAFMCGIVDGLSGRMGPCRRTTILGHTPDTT